jgi:hypothetical protein
VFDQEAAEHYARVYKDHNPKLRFRYRPAAGVVAVATNLRRSAICARQKG